VGIWQVSQFKSFSKLWPVLDDIAPVCGLASLTPEARTLAPKAMKNSDSPSHGLFDVCYSAMPIWRILRPLKNWGCGISNLRPPASGLVEATSQTGEMVVNQVDPIHYLIRAYGEI
jgi:hypothetical protein